ncbi:VOC family protein [Leptolyngbya ohadii]|uniref:VOC family protein n=1 Tax=Leptolyngbya ohadii TaxID=1962290 RepID=UPI000B59A919|nr:VOC family protein [Leptolyngbya ohadii]
MKNPVGYFEIPVVDLDRAIQFYEKVLGYEFERTTIDGNDMAWFPFDENAAGISGALAKGESYVPSTEGTLIYFSTDSIDETLTQVQAIGGKILYPKTSIGGQGWVAEFEDSEGNRIALHSQLEAQ